MSITALDHVMINIADHGVAADQFKRMGFLLRGFRPNAPMGGGPAGGVGGSDCILFPSDHPNAANFLEISVWDRDCAHPMMRDILGEIEGPQMLVHATEDAGALHADWSSKGLHLNPIVDVDFPAADGLEAQKMRLIIPQGGKDPINVNAVQYANVDDFKTPEKTTHPNTAYCWDACRIICADDALPAMIQHFSNIYSRAPNEETPTAATFRIEQINVELLTQTSYTDKFTYQALPTDRVLPYAAGVRVRVARLDALKEILEKNKISAFITPIGTLAVSPTHACNTFLEFIGDA